MRRVALWVALVLLVCPTAWAQTMTFGDLFTLEVPDDWVDLSSLISQDDMAGFVGSPMASELKLSLYIDEMQDGGEFDLREASEADIQDLSDLLMENTEGSEQVEVLTAEESEIPFVLIQGADTVGDYAFACTVIDGNVVSIVAYAYEDRYYKFTRELYDSDLRLFRNVIGSAAPAC